MDMITSTILMFLLQQQPLVVDKPSTASPKFVKPSAESNAIPVGALSLFGYPKARLVYGKYVAKENFLSMTLQTGDSIDKVSEFYETQLFFPKGDPGFDAVIRTNENQGVYYQKQSRTLIYYYKDKVSNTASYSTTHGRDLIVVTLSQQGQLTTIFVNHINPQPK